MDTSTTGRSPGSIRLTMELGVRTTSGDAGFVPAVTIFEDRSLASLLADRHSCGIGSPAGADVLSAGQQPAYRITWTWPETRGPSDGAAATQHLAATTSLIWESTDGPCGMPSQLLP